MRVGVMDGARASNRNLGSYGQAAEVLSHSLCFCRTLEGPGKGMQGHVPMDGKTSVPTRSTTLPTPVPTLVGAISFPHQAANQLPTSVPAPGSPASTGQ